MCVLGRGLNRAWGAGVAFVLAQLSPLVSSKRVQLRRAQRQLHCDNQQTAHPGRTGKRWTARFSIAGCCSAGRPGSAEEREWQDDDLDQDTVLFAKACVPHANQLQASAKSQAHTASAPVSQPAGLLCSPRVAGDLSLMTNDV